MIIFSFLTFSLFSSFFSKIYLPQKLTRIFYIEECFQKLHEKLILDCFDLSLFVHDVILVKYQELLKTVKHKLMLIDFCLSYNNNNQDY